MFRHVTQCVCRNRHFTRNKELKKKKTRGKVKELMKKKKKRLQEK